MAMIQSMHGARLFLTSLVALAAAPVVAQTAQPAGRVVLAAGAVQLVRGGNAQQVKMGMDVRAGDVIRTAPKSTAQLWLRDGSMIAAKQNLGHIESAPGCRLGIARIFEQSIAVGLFNQAFSISNYARNQASDCFDHRQSSYFATVQHIVAKANHSNLSLRSGKVHHSLINSFVAATSKHNVRFI